MMNRGVLSRQMFAKGGAAFPDLNKDGEVTQADILMGRGVEFKQEGGIAGMMQPPAPAPEQLDPQAVEQMMMAASQTTGDLEGAQDFEQMMNMVRGDDATMSERREELAGVVGPEDAMQTPESVLALVQPVMQIAAVDQGIGELAQQEMQQPMQGPMAQGIMENVAPPAAPAPVPMGGPPPVNFKDGGLVRRGDNQPVQKFQNAGVVLPNAPTVGTLEQAYEKRLPLYKGILGDPTAQLEEQKKLTQAQMYFDLANTALAFAAPMQGERPGMSPAERLARAAQETKLLPTIGARAQQQLDRKQAATAAEQKMKLGALTAAEADITAQAKARAAFDKERLSGAQRIAELGVKDALDTKRDLTLQADLFEKKDNLQNSKFALQAELDTASDARRLEIETELKQIDLQNDKIIEQIRADNKQALQATIADQQQQLAILKNDIKFQSDTDLQASAAKINENLAVLKSNLRIAELGVANEFDLEKLDKAHEQATELNNTNNALKEKLSGLDRELNERRLRLETIKAEVTRAQGQEKIDLQRQAQEMQAEMNAFEQSYKTEKLDLEKAASRLTQFGSSVDGRIMGMLTGTGAFQEGETSAQLAARYAGGQTSDQEDIALNQAIDYFVSPKSVWNAEQGAFVSVEGNRLAEEWRKAVDQRKGSNLSVPTLGAAPAADATTVVTAETPAAGTAVLESLNATAGDLPSVNNLGEPTDISQTTYDSIIASIDPTLATGAPSAFKQGLNRTVETLLPVFGQPFPETSRAVTLLSNLNTTTSAAILAAQPGKEAEPFRQEIKGIFPTAAAWTRGDETSYNQIEATIAYLNKEIATLAAEERGPVNPARKAQIGAGISSLLTVRDAYSALGRGYESRQGAGSGEKPPIESFFN